jgi:hypothetical protein
MLLGWVAALVLCGEALELLGAGWSAATLHVCALAAWRWRWGGCGSRSGRWRRRWARRLAGRLLAARRDAG